MTTRTKRGLALAGAGVLLAAAMVPTTGAMQPTGITFERMAQPFLHSPAQPLTVAERAELDLLGNRNGVYDIGDIRLILLQFPGLAPQHGADVR